MLGFRSNPRSIFSSLRIKGVSLFNSSCGTPTLSLVFVWRFFWKEGSLRSSTEVARHACHLRLATLCKAHNSLPSGFRLVVFNTSIPPPSAVFEGILFEAACAPASTAGHLGSLLEQGYAGVSSGRVLKIGMDRHNGRFPRLPIVALRLRFEYQAKEPCCCDRTNSRVPTMTKARGKRKRVYQVLSSVSTSAIGGKTGFHCFPERWTRPIRQKGGDL